ncbi:MAG: HDIG domain-containing protein [Defluviitaleaceae bacterium]|nr:HDIG domain-containing protein [Defluviitaleaceae bacterium]
MRDRQKKKKRQIPLYITVLTIVAYVVSLIVIGFDYIAPQTHDITVGMIAPVDFSATRQIENTFLTNNARDAAAAAIAPQWQVDYVLTNEILQNVNDFFAQISAMRAQNMPIISPFDYEEAEEARPFVPTHDGLLVELTDEQLIYLVEVGSSFLTPFRIDLVQGIEEILEEQLSATNVMENRIIVLRNELTEDRGEFLGQIGFEVATAFLHPNLVPNEVDTERMRQEARAAVTPITFQMNQMIVRAGEPITEEHYAALVELGYVGTNFAAIFSRILGSFLAVTVVFTISIFFIHLFMKEMALDKKKIVLLFTLYMMVLVLARVMVPLAFYFTPIMLFAMLCAILIDMRLSAVLTVAVSIITIVMDPTNTMFITYVIVNGIFAAMIARRIIVRSNMWSAAIAFVLVNALTVFANYFLFGAGFGEAALTSALLAMVGGVMTITLAYGSLPLWESLFSVITQNTLLELTNPDNALLRRLLIETPGTYHHSLVVANLAEAACYDIGANHVLARVGAYYHDIGKMKYPQYFAENQTEANPHDHLPPTTSVEVINEHVTGGLALARQHKLPEQVMDFIEQHHGTSLMKVFLHKTRTANPDADVDEKAFRYPHRIPQNPETAVVMLADTCEAAVRAVYSKGDKDLGEMEGFVRKLIKDKLDDGQLNESGLSIKDLDTIALSFMRVFKGMHHERIPYPSGTKPESVDAKDKMLDEVTKRG